MKVFSGLAIIPVLLFPAAAAFGDRGPVVWSEGVALSQESQKAIILHNGAEEILILGTEMKAARESEILEFIPFSSEPEVGLANGNPFGEIGRMVREKGLVFEYSDVFEKGGGAGGAMLPVEILFSDLVGLHDVTTIKINDLEHFARWLRGFFEGKGIPFQEGKFQAVYAIARDYMERGYSYFVFDSVTITQDLKFLEPLAYRFRTDNIYFPLKTSNLIGGDGSVEMIFVLPGSVSDDIWQRTQGIFGPGPDREIRLSSSAKLYSGDVARIHGPEPFFGRSKIYLQVLKYDGAYDFLDDFTYDVKKLVPYAYRFREENPLFGQLDLGSSSPIPPLTAGERRDMREAFCPRRDAPDNFLLSMQLVQLDCWDYIPGDEYAVYDALFRRHPLAGIPQGNVALEGKTVPRQYKSGGTDIGADDETVQDFNDRNRVACTLENGFEDTGEQAVRIRSGKDGADSRDRTYVSRAGFNRNRDEALVYAEHGPGPGAGAGYYVKLRKTGGEWRVSGFHPGDVP